MVSGLENIADKEYLGRMLMIGRIGNDDVIVYAITGRSEPSRARKIIQNDKLELVTTQTTPTDSTVLERGIKPLLLYNCTRRSHDNLIVGNGAQTDLVFDTLERQRISNSRITPIDILVEAFRRPYLVQGNDEVPLIDLTKYEPDPPNWTSRITGLITAEGAAIHIVRWVDGSPIKTFFEIPLIASPNAGLGKVIATYTGRNVPSGHQVPRFEGEPFDVVFQGNDPESIASEFYEALGPMKPGTGILSPGLDFRVGVVAVMYNREFQKPRIHIKLPSD